MKFIIFLLLFVTAAGAQPVSVGVVFGRPQANAIANQTIDGIKYESKSWLQTGGAVLQIDLSEQFRLETDLIYRHIIFSATNQAQRTSAHDFNIPLIMQVVLKPARDPIVHYFVGGGGIFEHLVGVNDPILTGPGSVAARSSSGVVAEVGAEILHILGKYDAHRVSFELRYTHLSSRFFSEVSRQNQAYFLIGIHF